MRSRITEISAHFPYFVYEVDNKVVGYCYAHPWKERAAYRYTLETTVYLSPERTGKGIGKQLMVKLIDESAGKDFTPWSPASRRGMKPATCCMKNLDSNKFPVSRNRTEVRPLVGCDWLWVSACTLNITSFFRFFHSWCYWKCFARYQTHNTI